MENWEEAYKWQEIANAKKSDSDQPRWRFDCNFKLDYDGPLMSISSRFYPPSYNKHNGWEGTIHVYVLGIEIEYLKKEIKKSSIDELKKESEEYVKHISKLIKQRFS